MIKAIVFDWAGVIGSDGYWIWLKKNIKDLENRKDYFQKISEEVDSAEISHEEFMQKLAEQTNRTSQQVEEEIKSEIIINKDLVEIINKLKHSYKIGLLSNFTYPLLNRILTENNLHELFHAQLISSIHKVIKPYPEIFQKMIEMLGVKAEEAIFIDDRQMHIEGAGKVGLKGILFTTNENLIKDLRKHGVEV